MFVRLFVYTFVMFLINKMDLVKQNIIETATRLFQQSGIRNVSIDDVCAALRISKKTFYQHFNKKEDLVNDVITSMQQQHVDFFEKHARSMNAIDMFIFSIKQAKKTVDHKSFIMWHDLEKFYPALCQRHESHKRDLIRETFEKNVRQGIEEGYFRKDLDIELISLFHTIQIKNTFGLMLEENKKYTMKRLVDFFVDLMIHLLANEKGLKYIEEHYKNNE